MKKLVIILPVALIVILGIIGWNATYKGKLALEKLGSTNEEVIHTGTTSSDNTTSPDSSAISQEEFAKHNTADDCWIVYKGSVYDITVYLPLHPGGSRSIAQFCGTLGFEAAFTKEHGTSKIRMLETKAGKLEGELTQ